MIYLSKIVAYLVPQSWETHRIEYQISLAQIFKKTVLD